MAEKTYQVKIRLTDLKAANPNAIAVENTFSVNVYFACQRNTLAFSGDQTSQTFVIRMVPLPADTINIANSAVTVLEAETVCVLNRMLEIYDKSKLTWVRYT